MKERVIFCQSYDQIENALYVATCNWHNSSITLVIPLKHNLFKFFRVINERVFHNTINIVYFESYQGRMAGGNRIEKALRLLLDILILRERQYLKAIFNRYFAELRGAEVFFFNKRFSTYSFYLLKKLSKGNRLVYIYSRSDAGLIRKVTPINIAELVNLIIWRLVYGRDIVMGELPYWKGIPCMPDKFLNENVDKVIDREESSEIMKDFDLSHFRVFDIGNYSVMYLGQYLVHAGYISDRDTFRRKLMEIFNILAKYFPDNKIAIKYAPQSHGNHDPIIKVGDVLPDFIPAEFLYNENVKMYLSICSTSIANVEKGLAVSLLDLITFKDDETRELLKETLIQRSRSEILFPKSLDEFERILVGVKRQTNA